MDFVANGSLRRAGYLGKAALTCEIVEGAEGEGVQFRITPMDAEEEAVCGGSPSDVWGLILDRINALRARTYEEQVMLPNSLFLFQCDL